MAQVLEFEPMIEAPPAEEAAAHRRIRRASKALAALFGVIFVAWCLLVAAGVLAFLIPYAGDHLTIGPQGMMLNLWFGPASAHPAAVSPAGYVAVSSLPLLQRLAHVLVSPIVILPSVMIFWNLRQLFRLYGQGVVFSEANARCIKHIGVWLAAGAVTPLASVLILGAVHMRIDHNWFHADTIPKIVLGGVVYVIGMVMAVGHELEQEQEQFV